MYVIYRHHRCRSYKPLRWRRGWGGGAIWPAGLLAEAKEGQAVLRETKAGAPAWAVAGAKAGEAIAAVCANLQQHEETAGVAGPKVAPDDAAPVKPVPDTAAANEARSAMDGGGAA